MAAFFGGGRVNRKTPPATSLRIQTALNGQPIGIVHGRQRVAGNLIWYGGFAHTGPGKGGGKGGVTAGGKGQQQTTYSADVIIGICEGSVASFGTVWNGQAIATLSATGASIFDGGLGQAAWGFITSAFSPYALGYNSLAYIGFDPLQLGSSPELPSLNFEVTGSVANAVTENYTIAGGGTFTPTYWNLNGSVVEQVTVPATAPYQVLAQNPFAATAAIVLQSGAGSAPGTSIYGPNIPGSAGNGVVDVNGRVFTRVTGTPSPGQYVETGSGSSGTPTVTYTFAAADAGLDVTIVDLALSPGVYFADGTPLAQVLGSPTVVGTFSVSVQPGSYGQYQFAPADAGKQVTIVDVPDADPSASLADYLSNARYGCGFPAANIGNLSALQNYAFATGMFISPALVVARAANDYLGDFAAGLNGEFVWSGGLLSFLPYGDTTLTGFGKTYTPPSTPIYSLDDDDFLKNEGTASVGVSAFTSDDPVVCVRTRPSDADNDVRIEYLDRGNAYNPAIAEAQDDAAIDLYGLRAADTKQLHFFCTETAAMTSAQLQLSRQQVRNLYSFTVPWYFILLDPMDIVAISDAALGLDNQWVRVREITENQRDGTLTITAEEYLPGTGSAPSTASQPRVGYAPNLDAAAVGVNCRRSFSSRPPRCWPRKAREVSARPATAAASPRTAVRKSGSRHPPPTPIKPGAAVRYGSRSTTRRMRRSARSHRAPTGVY